MTNVAQKTIAKAYEPSRAHLILSWFFYFFCRALLMTWRIKYIGMDRRRMGESISATNTVIFAVLHEHAAGCVITHGGQKLCNMVSRSKDGEFVAFISEKLGHKPVRGSSSRGGKEVRDEMMDAMREGYHGAVTIDGPKGPRRIVKPGVVDLSRKMGAPIVPTVAVADRQWVLRKTWDQTKIPKPFARIIIYYGEPISVSQGASGTEFSDAVGKVQQTLALNDDLVSIRFDEIWSRA